MSIPIAARRYLEKIGVPGSWVSIDYPPECLDRQMFFVVIEGWADEFHLTVACYTVDHGWLIATANGWVQTKQTIVCWSEIKT